MKQIVLKKPLALFLALLMVFGISATGIYNASAVTTKEQLTDITTLKNDAVTAGLHVDGTSKNWDTIVDEVIAKQVTNQNAIIVVELPANLDMTGATKTLKVSLGCTVVVIPNQAANSSTVQYAATVNSAFQIVDGKLRIAAGDNQTLDFVGTLGTNDLAQPFISLYDDGSSLVGTNSTRELIVDGQDITFTSFMTDGDGAVIAGYTNQDADISIYGPVTFDGNIAGGDGTVIATDGGTTNLTIQPLTDAGAGATFANGLANGKGSAISLGNDRGTVIIEKATFSGNESGDVVGALSILGTDRQVTLKNSTFTGNTSTADGYHDGSISSNNLTLEQNMFDSGAGGASGGDQLNIPTAYTTYVIGEASAAYPGAHHSSDWAGFLNHLRTEINNKQRRHRIVFNSASPLEVEIPTTFQTNGMNDGDHVDVIITTTVGTDVTLKRGPSMAEGSYMFAFGGAATKNTELTIAPVDNSSITVDSDNRGPILILGSDTHVNLLGKVDEKGNNTIILKNAVAKAETTASAIEITPIATDGIVQAADGVRLNVNNVTFENNTGGAGTVSVKGENNTVAFNNVLFDGNKTTSAQGTAGVYIEGGTTDTSKNKVELSDTDITTNNTGADGQPSSIYVPTGKENNLDLIYGDNNVVGAEPIIAGQPSIDGLGEGVGTSVQIHTAPTVETGSYTMDATFKTVVAKDVAANGGRLYETYLTLDLYMDLAGLKDVRSLQTLDLAFKYNNEMYQPGELQSNLVTGAETWVDTPSPKLTKPTGADAITIEDSFYTAAATMPGIYSTKDTYVYFTGMNITPDTTIADGKYHLGSMTFKVKNDAQEDEVNARASAAEKGLTWTAYGTEATKDAVVTKDSDYDIHFVGQEIQVDGNKEATAGTVDADLQQFLYTINPTLEAQVQADAPVNSYWNRITLLDANGIVSSVFGNSLYFDETVLSTSYLPQNEEYPLTINSAATGNTAYNEAINTFWSNTNFQDELKNNAPTVDGYNAWNALTDDQRAAIDTWDYIGTRTYSRANLNVDIVSHVGVSGRDLWYHEYNTQVVLSTLTQNLDTMITNLDAMTTQSLLDDTIVTFIQDPNATGAQIQTNQPVTDVPRQGTAKFVGVSAGTYVLAINKDGHLPHMQKVEVAIDNEQAIKALEKALADTQKPEGQRTAGLSVTSMVYDTTEQSKTVISLYAGDVAGTSGPNGLIDTQDKSTVAANMSTVLDPIVPDRLQTPEAIYDLDNNGFINSYDVEIVNANIVSSQRNNYKTTLKDRLVKYQFGEDDGTTARTPVNFPSVTP